MGKLDANQDGSSLSEKPLLPKHAQAIGLILQSMGVEESDPRVIHQLMDFTFRTTLDFLDAAGMYAEHCGRTDINVDDVKLAIQNKVNAEFHGPPPREVCYSDFSSFTEWTC